MEKKKERNNEKRRVWSCGVNVVVVVVYGCRSRIDCQARQTTWGGGSPRLVPDWLTDAWLLRLQNDAPHCRTGRLMVNAVAAWTRPGPVVVRPLFFLPYGWPVRRGMARWKEETEGRLIFGCRLSERLHQNQEPQTVGHRVACRCLCPHWTHGGALEGPWRDLGGGRLLANFHLQVPTRCNTFTKCLYGLHYLFNPPFTNTERRTEQEVQSDTVSNAKIPSIHCNYLLVLFLSIIVFLLLLLAIPALALSQYYTAAAIPRRTVGILPSVFLCEALCPSFRCAPPPES
jgi:hypothetical protein